MDTPPASLIYVLGRGWLIQGRASLLVATVSTKSTFVEGRLVALPGSETPIPLFMLNNKSSEGRSHRVNGGYWF